MNVVIEKREVVGVLKTQFGTYAVLEENLIRRVRLGAFEGTTTFHVIDNEGFENNVYVSGAYDYLPFAVHSFMEVKVLTQEQPELTQETID